MTRAPVVLIVSQHEWASRSLGSVISSRGYSVLRAYNGKQGLAEAERADPDAIFIDVELPLMTGADLTRQMLEWEVASKAAPIFLVSSGHVTREQKLEALEAGVWDILALPLDAEELLLRIERYSRGKLEADRLREDALIDGVTGLYSWHGISRRIGEVAAAAARNGRPLACIVVSTSDVLQDEDSAPAGSDEVTRLARELRAAVRASDILGRIGPGEFAVVAPDTPDSGAQVLATRLREISTDTEATRRFRAGVCAVDNLQTTTLDPMEFLVRATRASHENQVN